MTALAVAVGALIPVLFNHRFYYWNERRMKRPRLLYDSVVLATTGVPRVTNALALPRLLPMSDRDNDAEILVLHHQIAVLQRQMGAQKPRFGPGDRALLAALLHRLPIE